MEELCNGTFYRKLLKKMPEKMIMQYQQWVFDKEQKSFVIQKAGLQKASAETIHGLHQTGNKDKKDHIYFSSQIKVNTRRSVYSAI